MNNTWLLEEPRLQFERRRGTDAIFTLGNGYLGCRGFFEEEQENVEALGGIYMAGVFGEGALKAWKGRHRELVNTPNFLYLAITIDGEQVISRPERIEQYRRVLNMRDGVLERTFVWKGRQGARVKFRFERFMSLADRHAAGQRVEITPLKGNPKIDVVAGIDARIVNLNMVTTSPLPIQPGRKHLKTLRIRRNVIETKVASLPDGVSIAEGQRVGIDGPSPGQLKRGEANAPELAGERYSWRGPSGQTVRLTKIVNFFTSRDGDSPERLLAGAMAGQADYDEMKSAHVEKWTRKWHYADVELDGAADDQRALRYNLFQLMQACPEHDSRVSLGARGLSGEMHEGSIFWDNEIFKLPFFTFSNPKATRSMLRFRHRTLPAARRHAAELWFSGAMYAWKSGDDGVEETEMGVGAYYAIHIVADIAYALRQYWEATADDDFLYRFGTEILIETARFWQSRTHFDPIRRTYNILAVRGPNEYDVIVHNNCYTNTMARENIRYAIDAIARMKKHAAADWKKLAGRLKFHDSEVAAWNKLMQGLVIPYDRRQDLYAEDDMYLHRVPFDMKRGKPDLRRVIDSSLPYEAMAYFQITKQSDIVTLMNLLPWQFTPKQMRMAYGFYEPKTVHDSSLSYSPHAVMAARLGLLDEAYRYWRDCAYLDITDIQLNTISGIHFANLGGTWQGALMGFGGLELRKGRLQLTPHLPGRWKALRFRLCYRGGVLRVEMRGRKTMVTVEAPPHDPIKLGIGNRLFTLRTVGQTASA